MPWFHHCDPCYCGLSVHMGARQVVIMHQGTVWLRVDPRRDEHGTYLAVTRQNYIVPPPRRPGAYVNQVHDALYSMPGRNRKEPIAAARDGMLIVDRIDKTKRICVE